MSNALFFVASLGWNVCLGMTWLAIPLYAASQGLSNAQIGALVSIPIIIQAPLALAGGAYTDRIGGRRIVLASSFVMALAGLWEIFATGFWMLLAGQFVLILSRAAFWPATWAMASELPGARSVQLGRLNAVTNVGNIAGAVLCGVLLSAVGFGPTFATLAGVGFGAFLATLGTQAAARKPAQAAHPVFASYGRLMRRRIIHYTMLCAYVSALPFSLSVSFYPLLLAQYGHSEDTSGALLGVRALGAIAAGLVASRFVRTGPHTLWPVLCGLAVAAAIGLLPLINHIAVIGFWMLLVGVASGAMTLYFQMTISEASGLEERGSALALGSLGWSMSHLSTPLIVGLIADRYGIVAGFYLLGAFGVAFSILLAYARRWAFAEAPTRQP